MIKPVINYTVIKELLERYGIDNVSYKDSAYVISGNRDLPQFGITHSLFIKGMVLYDEIVTKYALRYKPEVFDCDDFARLLKVVYAMVGVNGWAYAECELYEKEIETFTFVGDHAHNVAPYALNPDCIILLLVEPQLYPYFNSVVVMKEGSNEARVLDRYKYRVYYAEF